VRTTSGWRSCASPLAPRARPTRCLYDPPAVPTAVAMNEIHYKEFEEEGYIREPDPGVGTPIDTVVAYLNTANRHTISLVDGKNLMFTSDAEYHTEFQAIGKQGKDNVDEAVHCIPPEKTQVVVVWTKEEWKRRILDQGDQGFERLLTILVTLNRLRANGTNVIFLLLDYPEVEKRGHDSSKQPICRLYNDPKTDDHLSCEMDDLLLTGLHCALLRSGRAVKVVSDDRRVLKTSAELEQISLWVEQKWKSHRRWAPRLLLYNVPVKAWEAEGKWPLSRIPDDYKPIYVTKSRPNDYSALRASEKRDIDNEIVELQRLGQLHNTDNAAYNALLKIEWETLAAQLPLPPTPVLVPAPAPAPAWGGGLPSTVRSGRASLVGNWRRDDSPR
jgi:hypothetical protein